MEARVAGQASYRALTAFQPDTTERGWLVPSPAQSDPASEWRLVVEPLAGLVQAAVAAVAALPLGAFELGGVELQAGADLVGVDLGHRPLVALGGFPGALAQPAGDHHPVALAERVGEVLGLVAPDVDLVEGGLPVPPGPILLLDARGDRHAEVGDRGAGVGEAQLGVGGEVADDRGVVVYGHQAAPWSAGLCGVEGWAGRPTPRPLPSG